MTVTQSRPTPAKASPIFGRMRGRVVILLCIMYAISYIDRTNISTAGPTIIKALDLTTAEFGIAVAAFSLPYALFQIIGGNLGERIGPRKALFWIGILWGVATIATGFSVGLASLVGARLLLGLTESAAFPTATSAMAKWVPIDRNGFVQGIVHSASRLGNAAAPLIVGGLIIWGDSLGGPIAGWQVSFIIVGVLSALWAVLWATLYRDRPEDYPRITEQELSEIPRALERAARPPVPWKRLIRTILPVTFVDFGYGWTLWVFLTWIPSFLADSYGLALADYAVFTAIVLLAGVVGDTVGGIFSDRILRRTGSLRNARRSILLIGLLGSLVCLTPLLFGHNLALSIVSLSLSFFFLELCNATLWAIPMDVAPEWSGTASGMMNTGFGLAGIFSPILFGYLVGVAGWQWPFAASIALLAAAAVVAAVMKPQRVLPNSVSEWEQTSSS
ncbi:MFS transporter [Glaciihabitans sp. INWT7]|uniref:MFS transporter n=1 Tax=Glaciihabitans sp. INWT7 TaxID=2596912 RepID=UPI00162A6D42|nr:MFS transporter [Glaciihabitans sp. INWT7]QNE46834.1 MFS transporter [Glaciihabitans sp. INWT7]